MTADASLISLTAIEIRDLLLKGDVSPLDLLDTLEARVAEVDPQCAGQGVHHPARRRVGHPTVFDQRQVGLAHPGPASELGQRPLLRPSKPTQGRAERLGRSLGNGRIVLKRRVHGV